MSTTAEQHHGLRTEQPAAWARRYSRYLSVTDAVVVVVAVILAETAWHSWTVTVGNGVSSTGPLLTNRHTIASVVLVVCWLTALSAYGTRDARIIGQGTLEYRRVLQSSLMLFGTYAIVAVILDLQLGRSFVLTAFPLAAVGLVISRWGWRQWLVRRREAGHYVSRALLVGSRHTVEHLAEQLAGQPSAGYHPAFGCVPGGREGEMLGRRGVRVVGTIQDVELVLSRIDVDCVIVTSSDDLSPRAVRHLGWSLEESGTELIVAPALTDIAGPRMHARPVAGLPLIHVESPVFGGRKAWTKVAIDRAAAALGVLLLSPLLLGIAIAIKSTSTGPVFFRQQRVGLGGETFTMFKFRSMSTDAEAQLEALREAQRNAGNEVLFKMKDDPRVTRVGAILRRYSLDELPQLFNVLNGTMSLVGPRPPLDSETKAYEKHNFRRFLVRPGITGLWQVSGRSDLSWEDSVRLDLYYVENWSVLNDFILLARTARAVLAGAGAY